ncbi:MAG: translation initiation factor IF-2, partial [Bacteroidetes bacterium]
MNRRLVKIAKELNVGLSTIVEFLTDKGYEIDAKPTAKVTDDMYNELLKEFHNSLEVKNRADQLVIGTRPSGGKKEEEAAPAGLKELTPKSRISLGGNLGSKPGISLSTKPTPPPQEPAPEPKAEPVAEESAAPPPAQPESSAEPAPEPAKTTADAAQVPEPAEPVAEETPAEEPKPKTGGLKVVGKIDLDSKTSKPKKAKPAPKAAEKPVAEEQPAPAETPEPAEPEPETPPAAEAPPAADPEESAATSAAADDD